MNIEFKFKNYIALIISVLLVLAGKFLTPFSALSQEGNASLFYMIAVVIIIATETLPTGLVAFAGIVFMPIIGIVPSLNSAASLFGHQLFFYMVACYVIASVMGKLPISKRILLFFLKTFNKSTKGTIIAIILTTTILSIFISNFPACLLIFIISKQYLSMIEDDKQRNKTKKSLMLGIIIAVGIGGIITPVGSSCMILASTYLADAGYAVSFLQWIGFGLPIALFMLPVSLFLLFKLFPPYEQDREMRAEFIKIVQEQIPSKYSAQEIITIGILIVTFVCWILNFNLLLVTCLCGIALLFPGFKLLSWKDFSSRTGWDSIMIVCTLVALVSVLQTTGVTDWLLSMLQNAVPSNLSSFVLVLIFALFTAVLVFIMPNGPALVAVLGTTIIAFAEKIGANPIVLVLGFAFFTTFTFTLPIDPISLIVYESGENYQPLDMPKVGIPIILITAVFSAIWLPICASFLGL